MAYPNSSATTSPAAWYRLPANYAPAVNPATPFTPIQPIPNPSGVGAGKAIPALRKFPIVVGFSQ